MTGRQPNGVQKQFKPTSPQHDAMPEISTGKTEVTSKLKPYVSRRPVLKNQACPLRISTSDQCI